jgi:hypothetical protein
VIGSLALDATGATLTYGVTTPTTIRLSDDRTSIVEPMASFLAGRYTWTTILDGLTVKCAVAQDAIGVESTNPPDGKYSSFTGIVPAMDTTPPVMPNR